MEKIKTGLIKKSLLKKMLAEKGMKINSGALGKFSDYVEGFVEDVLSRAVRQARISGRKVVRGEDVG